MNQSFPYYFYLVIEGFGSGSVHRTLLMDQEPDPGGLNIQIRIRNTAVLGSGGDREYCNTLGRRCPGYIPSWSTHRVPSWFSLELSFRIGSGCQCCGSGSGIRDWVPFLTPGFGIRDGR
jgi:hypothetical protein